jgi:hypothetical protein
MKIPLSVRLSSPRSFLMRDGMNQFEQSCSINKVEIYKSASGKNASGMSIFSGLQLKL